MPSTQQVWLVTGAAGALGRALVDGILAAGDDCIALDRDARGLDRLHDDLLAAGRQPPALMPLDLAGASPDDYRQLAGEVGQRFGRLDVLVHNAAELVALRPLVHQSPEEWMRIIQSGLTAPFLLNRELMPLLAESGRAVVVFISDRHCLDKPANWAAYGVAQAGREWMSRALTAEAGRRGACVVEIDPGPFFSRLRTAAWPSASADELADADSAAAAVLAEIRSMR